MAEPVQVALNPEEDPSINTEALPEDVQNSPVPEVAPPVKPEEDPVPEVVLVEGETLSENAVEGNLPEGAQNEAPPAGVLIEEVSAAPEAVVTEAGAVAEVEAGAVSTFDGKKLYLLAGGIGGGLLLILIIYFIIKKFKNSKE